jgi:hypothetical protein
MIFDPAFKVGILHAEVEQAAAPIFERAIFFDGIGEFEQLDPDAVTHRQMRNAETAPALSKNIITHLADGAVVVFDFRRRHQHVEIEGLRVELDRLLEIRNSDADVRECQCDHEGIPRA